MPPPLPRHSVWTYRFAHFIQTYQSSPKGLSGRPAHCPFRGLLGVHSRCGLTLALSPIRDTLIEGFSHVTSMTAPIASGWSDCRVGFAPTGKRRLCTAHTQSGHSVCWNADANYVPPRNISIRHSYYPQRGAPLPRIAGWGMTEYLITLAMIGIVIILIAEYCA